MTDAPTATQLANRVRRGTAFNGDIDPSGNLVEPGRWHVTGWRTRGVEEDGERHGAGTPGEVAALVERLLWDGCYQIVVDDAVKPELLEL